jgi:hypothetical protein
MVLESESSYPASQPAADQAAPAGLLARILDLGFPPLSIGQVKVSPVSGNDQGSVVNCGCLEETMKQIRITTL